MSEEQGARFNPYKRFKKCVYIPSEIAVYDGIGWPAKAVYGALLSFVSKDYDPEHGVNARLTVIGERIGMDRSNVCRHLKSLVNAGLLEERDCRYFFLHHEAIDNPEALRNHNKTVAKMQQNRCENATQSCENATQSCEIATPHNKEGIETMNSVLNRVHDETETENIESLSPADMILKIKLGEGQLVGRQFAQNLYEQWRRILKDSEINQVLTTALKENHNLDWATDQVNLIFRASKGAADARHSVRI